MELAQQRLAAALDIISRMLQCGDYTVQQALDEMMRLQIEYACQEVELGD